MAKKYRMDTPKGQTQHAFDTEGKDQATKIAKQHDIAESRLNRWFREWSGEASPTRSSAGSKGNKSEEILRSKSGYTPIWYDTEKRAEQVMNDKIKTLNMDPSVYVLVNDGKGKFGFAPLHLAHEFNAPEVKPDEFKNNERIEYKLALGQFGKVVTAGAEVSDVLWDGGRSEAVPNYYIKPAPKGNKATTTKAKAEEPKAEPVAKPTKKGAKEEKGPEELQKLFTTGKKKPAKK